MPASHLEIGADDAGRARDFFVDLFAWEYTTMDGGGRFDTGGVSTGLHGGDARPGIVVYFEVPDVAAVAARVRELGGEADEPSPEEPGYGRFAACTDPQDIRFGLHQR